MSTTFDPNYIQPKDYVLLSIKVLVQNPEKKILLLHRSKLSPGRKGWDFCGGAPDKKEDPTTAAAREAKEEALQMELPEFFNNMIERLET